MANYVPPQAVCLLLLPGDFLQTSPTSESYDDELVYEGF